MRGHSIHVAALALTLACRGEPIGAADPIARAPDPARPASSPEDTAAAAPAAAGSAAAAATAQPGPASAAPVAAVPPSDPAAAAAPAAALPSDPAAADVAAAAPPSDPAAVALPSDPAAVAPPSDPSAAAAVTAADPTGGAAASAAAPAPTPASGAREPGSDAEDGLDGDGWPRLDPTLRNAERLAEGPWIENPDIAIGAGWVDFSRDEMIGIIAQVDSQRRSYALATGPSRAPRPRGSSSSEDFVSIWLARLESRTDEEEGVTLTRRLAAVRLYDGAVETSGMDSPDYECTVASELRARDVDGDREIELTVLAQYYRPVEDESEECGTVAFLVGGDDLRVQARFSRQYFFFQTDAGGEVGDKRQTTWQFRDIDADGHADLHVTETWAYRDDFMGDDIGDGEVAPASHERRSERRELDCPWIAAEDVWRCPADQPAPGLALFVDQAERGAGRGQRPW